eukprot:gene23819-biopygen5864
MLNHPIAAHRVPHLPSALPVQAEGAVVRKQLGRFASWHQCGAMNQTMSSRKHYVGITIGRCGVRRRGQVAQAPPTPDHNAVRAPLDHTCCKALRCQNNPGFDADSAVFARMALSPQILAPQILSGWTWDPELMSFTSSPTLRNTSSHRHSPEGSHRRPPPMHHNPSTPGS